MPMSVLRVGVALVMGAMLLAVAAAKARQDGPKNGRPSEIRITSDGVAAAKARQDGPKKVALLEPAFGLTAAPELITTRIGQIKLKRIPAGEFMMSSNSSASGYDEEFLDNAASEAGKKKHRVRITRPFYLGVYEVTQAQYEAVMGNNPSFFTANGRGKDRVPGQSTDRHPVEQVGWLDAVKFCNKLSEREGIAPFYEIDGGKVTVADWNRPGYRLPTEAEWQYACRANTSTRYPFGDDAARLGEYGWFSGNSGDKTHPVGEKRPNGFGLYDMLGNVSEYCWDAHDEPSHMYSGRVYCGGDWGARSACRDAGDCRAGNLGFRLALFQSVR
jgi:formylglycine-generating enzyme required for sulfatase activity